MSKTCHLCDATRPEREMVLLPTTAADPEEWMCGDGLEFACLDRQEKNARAAGPGLYKTTG